MNRTELELAEINSIRIARVQAFAFRAPIETPVATSFGVMNDRPAVLVRVEDDTGAHGWGEIWCNFPTCGAEHRVRFVDTVISPLLTSKCHAGPAAASSMLGDATRILAIQCGEPGPIHQAIAAIDVALNDLVARRAGQPLYQYAGTNNASAEIPVYASGISPFDAASTIVRARANGYSAFKIKVGFEPRRDVAAAEAARDELKPDERLMFDANQGWDLPTAKKMAAALVPTTPDWLEEPLAADRPSSEWQALANHVNIELAAGENLSGDCSYQKAIDGGYLGVIQPDVAKWGGFSGCLRVGRLAVQRGLRYCPHFLGSGLGLMASAHLLASVGGEGRLEIDVNPNPLRDLFADRLLEIRDGRLKLPQGPGLGVEPDIAEAHQWLTLKSDFVAQ